MTESESQAALDAVMKSAEKKHQDPSGTWKWTGPQGAEWVLTLKLEGEKLSGIVIGPDGLRTQIRDPKIIGDVIAFLDIREITGVENTFSFAGKIVGDTIQGKRVVQPRFGATRIADWQAKRESTR